MLSLLYYHVIARRAATKQSIPVSDNKIAAPFGLAMTRLRTGSQ